ncbi:MAG: dihydroorotase, partial [Oscillospiraceae bacterium]|nr:dihydroorotase [Oscillospiraceae bacterium]
HYFTDGAAGVMNPPLASPDDVAAVRQGLIDGTIDAIVTDHAPHTEREKAQEPCPNGVIGLETAFGAALTALVHPGLIPLDKLRALMRDNPARILGIAPPEGEFSVDTERLWTVDPDRFRSKARNTPFAGLTLRGQIIL